MFCSILWSDFVLEAIKISKNASDLFKVNKRNGPSYFRILQNEFMRLSLLSICRKTCRFPALSEIFKYQPCDKTKIFSCRCLYGLLLKFYRSSSVICFEHVINNTQTHHDFSLRYPNSPKKSFFLSWIAIETISQGFKGPLGESNTMWLYYPVSGRLWSNKKPDLNFFNSIHADFWIVQIKRVFPGDESGCYSRFDLVVPLNVWHQYSLSLCSEAITNGLPVYICNI